MPGAWAIERYRARLIPVTSEIPEDETVAAVVQRYWKPIAAHYDEFIGTAAADFINRGDDLTPYNLFADTVRARFKTAIDLENLGGIRAELPKGRITLADLINMDPFENTVVTCSISGRRLKENLLRYRPAVSGVQYRIEGGKLAYAAVGNRTINDTRMYTVSTNSFFANAALKDIKVKDSGRTRFAIVEESIRQAGTVKPVFDGRRVIIDWRLGTASYGCLSQRKAPAPFTVAALNVQVLIVTGIVHQRHHSARKASTGSMRDALTAGQVPEISPMTEILTNAVTKTRVLTMR